MIVPTMSLAEVHHEMLYDFEAVQRKACAQSKLMQQQMARKGLKHEQQCLKYTSARKTEWTILYNIFTNNIRYVIFTEATDKRGKVAYQFLFDPLNHENGIVKYNTHFFQRYRERQHPHLHNPSDIIRHFFKHNFECHIGQTQELKDGRRLTSYVFTEGVGMGWMNKDKRLVNLKTFMPHHMLSNKQQSFADFIVNYKDGDEFEMTLKNESIINNLK